MRVFIICKNIFGFYHPALAVATLNIEGVLNDNSKIVLNIN